MTEDLLNNSVRSPRFSKRNVTKREFKFTSPTVKTPQNRTKAQDADPKVRNSEQKSNENIFDLPPPIWASSPRDTPYNKVKSKRQKRLLEISCIEPLSLKTPRKLKCTEISHFAPTATPKQNIAKNNANEKEALLTKKKRNKTTSITGIDYLQNSGKERIQNKRKSLSSSQKRVVKSNQETDTNNCSNKSNLKKNESKQLTKKEKSKVSDQEITTSKSQQQNIQSNYSRNARKSPSVHSEPSTRKTKSLIRTKSKTEIEIDLPVSEEYTNKKQTSISDFVSKRVSIKRKLQKSQSSEDYLSNPPKSSKLQTSKKQSIETANLSQLCDDYPSNTNKRKSGKASRKKQKSDIIASQNYSGAKPKQQTGSRLDQRSRSLPKDDPSPPNITHTKQSSNQRSSRKNKTSSSSDSYQTIGQKGVKVSKVNRVSRSNSSSKTDQSHKIKDNKSNQRNNKFVDSNPRKNALRKSSLREFNLRNEEQSKNTVKEKTISNFQEKKLVRRSMESSASSGKKKRNSINKISSRSQEKTNQSKAHSSTKLNAGKYANILSYLSTQNKQQKSNRTDKTFKSIATGITDELTHKKDADKRFSFDGSEISSVYINNITSSSDENDPKLVETNKYLEYIMFAEESDNGICLDNPKPIRLNVLENKNSMKRTVKSLSELDVILDVMDQSIELVLRQVNDVDKKLVISRMRNFVKEKISTDIKRQLQFIQLQNILHQKSVQIKGLQQKYFDLKITSNRLNNRLNEAMKTKVEDPTKMFDEFCKQFSEFKKL